jgi:hypothetical protein
VTSCVVTVVPTLMVSVFGLKAKLPLLFVVMVIDWPSASVVFALAVVAVVEVAVALEPNGALPPQAAMRARPHDCGRRDRGVDSEGNIPAV